MKIEIPNGYEALGLVLNQAINQAAKGKGKERHAIGEPFYQQPICEISRQVVFCSARAIVVRPV